MFQTSTPTPEGVNCVQSSAVIKAARVYYYSTLNVAIFVVLEGGLANGEDARGKFHSILHARGYAAEGARCHHGRVSVGEVS